MFNLHVHGCSPSTRVFKFRSMITKEVTEFYPERGMVTIDGAHYKTGEPYFKRESRREFLIRAAALSMELKAMDYSDERVNQQRLVDMMVEVAKAAKEQGDPYDPRALHDIAASALPKTIFNLGGAGFRPATDYAAFDPGIPAAPKAPMDKPIERTCEPGLIIPANIRYPEQITGC